MGHRRLASAATPGVVRSICARIVLAAALGFYSLANQPGTFAQGTGDHWVGTWATAAYAPPPLRAAPQNQARQALPSSFNNQTLRQIVHASIGGERVRVVLSNVFGTAPLAGRTATATVPLIVPGTLFEDRTTRLDLRLSKLVRLPKKLRLQANLDIYNALNSSSIIQTNTTYGSQWLRPQIVVDGRIFQVGGRLSF